MTIAVFTTHTDPLERGDLFFQSIASYAFADELVMVDGSATPRIKPGIHEIENQIVNQVNYEWPYEFDWTFIGQQFHRGYEAATSDWVIHCDLDFIFHERDFGKIRQAFKDYPSAPAISFYKWQFIQPDRYNLKSRLILAVNKKVFGDRIKFNGGGDLCQPTLDGKDLDINELPQAGVAFYNYEHILKTKAQVRDDVERMERAYRRHFKTKLYGDDPFDGWLDMMKGRYKRPSEKLPFFKHPKFIQETIKLLKPDQFGYNGWGLLEG